MFWYYVINIILVVFGGCLGMFGLICTWISVGNHRIARDNFGILVGIFCMVLAIGCWWISGSVYPVSINN